MHALTRGTIEAAMSPVSEPGNEKTGGAGGRNRTDMGRSPRDFESRASTSSATPASLRAQGLRTGGCHSRRGSVHRASTEISVQSRSTPFLEGCDHLFTWAAGPCVRLAGGPAGPAEETE